MPVRTSRNAGFLREIRKDVHRMRLFDVLGPVMIGPSSSHTAGAAKIGYTAQKLLGDLPVEAEVLTPVMYELSYMMARCTR